MCEIWSCGKSSVDEKGKFQRFPRILYHFSIFPPLSFLSNPIENMEWTARSCARKGHDHLQHQREGIWASTLGRCSTGSRRRCRWCFLTPLGKNTCDCFDLEARKKGIKHNRIAIKIVLQRLVDNWRLPQKFKNQEMCFQFERLQFQVVFSIAHWKLVPWVLVPRSYHTTMDVFLAQDPWNGAKMDLQICIEKILSSYVKFSNC